MKKPPRHKKTAPPPAKFARADKLKVIAFLLLFFVAPMLFWHFHAIHLQAASVSKTVEEWKTLYHITNSQAERIKQIELDFHGSGSPFSIQGHRMPDEKHRHHTEISRLMSPDDGARFMKVMEKSQGRH